MTHPVGPLATTPPTATVTTTPKDRKEARMAPRKIQIKPAGVQLEAAQWDRLSWAAQVELQRLAVDNQHMAARLAVGPDQSDTFADPYDDPPTPLGSGTLVEFRAAGERFHVQLTSNRSALEVRSYNGYFVVRPRCSNVVEIQPVPR